MVYDLDVSCCARAPTCHNTKHDTNNNNYNYNYNHNYKQMSALPRDEDRSRGVLCCVVLCCVVLCCVVCAGGKE
jgi:hypothetical protein